jgi:hypothetical protein
MGYYTNYELEMKGFKSDTTVPTEEEVIKVLAELEPNIFGLSTGHKDFAECLYQPMKWYGHEKTLKKISEQFRDIIFTLHGEGEEAEDIWNEYYLNGEVFVAKAIIYIPTFKEVYNKQKGE